MLLKEESLEPTTAKGLVMGYPKYLVWVDSSREDVGGGWLQGKDAPEPKFWRLEWPKKLWARLVTPTNLEEDLDINDLEMTGNILAWLVLEGIVGNKNIHYKHVGLFSDNTAAVSWTQRGVAKKYASEGRLLRVLALQQRLARMSSLLD